MGLPTILDEHIKRHHLQQGLSTGWTASIWQFGHSKDDPTLRQIKAMMATLDPLGLPLAIDVVSGERADDPLYVPTIERALCCLGRKGLLVVGDCKMSALSTRAYLQEQGQYYLTPLAQIGETAEFLPGWIEVGVAKGKALTSIMSEDGKRVLAEGYELGRTCRSGEFNWQERVLVIRSVSHAQAETRHFQERLHKAQSALVALTPPVGRGKHQIKEEETLHCAASAILAKHRVTGLLSYTYERHVEQKVVYLGRGRRGPNRPSKLQELVRYQITGVTLN
jgi:transposase